MKNIVTTVMMMMTQYILELPRSVMTSIRTATEKIEMLFPQTLHTGTTMVMEMDMVMQVSLFARVIPLMAILTIRTTVPMVLLIEILLPKRSATPLMTTAMVRLTKRVLQMHQHGISMQMKMDLQEQTLRL